MASITGASSMGVSSIGIVSRPSGSGVASAPSCSAMNWSSRFRDNRLRMVSLMSPQSARRTLVVRAEDEVNGFQNVKEAASKAVVDVKDYVSDLVNDIDINVRATAEILKSDSQELESQATSSSNELEEKLGNIQNKGQVEADKVFSQAKSLGKSVQVEADKLGEDATKNVQSSVNEIGKKADKAVKDLSK